jgi:hypothetical protein
MQQQAQRSWPGTVQPKTVFSPGVFADSPSPRPHASARFAEDVPLIHDATLLPRNLATDASGSGVGSSAGSGFSGAMKFYCRTLYGGKCGGKSYVSESPIPMRMESPCEAEGP